jgi:hypothetical protein
VTQNLKYIVLLLCLCILRTKLESRLYSKTIFLCIPISHNRTISLYLWRFSFKFKSHKNRIYSPFHQLYTTHHDVQIQVNLRLWLCIDPGRGVLFTIIAAILACIGKTEGKANIYSNGLGLTTAYSSLPFYPDISVYKSRIRDRI